MGDFTEDFPEEIANVFGQSKYLKPSDLPYMSFVSRGATYKAVGPEEKDSFLFLDKGCTIDIERKHKSSIFARKYAVILQSEQSIGKNETYIFNNVDTFCSVGPYQDIKSKYPSILYTARDLSDFFINIDTSKALMSLKNG